MVYDEATGRLFVGHKASQSATVIQVATGQVEGTIRLGGIPEFPVSDGRGNVYVNIDDKSEIVQIDSKSLAIKARWPLAPCKSPSGLAYDPGQRRLFAACENNLMAIVDADSGKLLATPAIGGKPDAAGYDPITKLAFSSNGDGTLTIIADRGNGKYEVVQNLQTQKGARTMTLDAKTHTIYLSTAELGPPPSPTPENPHPVSHPTAIPGTFKVLIARPASH
jgi:hypothetical protein